MPSRSRNLLSVGFLAVLLLPAALGLVRTANRIIVPLGDTISEDLYAFGGSVTVEGVVDGEEQGEPRPPALQPVVITAIHLQQHSLL